MTSPHQTVRVFVNATGISVPGGTTALDAVRAADAAAADDVTAGRRIITDSRGLPADPASPVHGGAIYRLVSARALRDAVAEEQEL